MTYQLERLVVRLIGDGTSYHKMLNNAESHLKRTAKLMQSQSMQMVDLNRQHSRAVTRIIEQRNLSMQIAERQFQTRMRHSQNMSFNQIIKMHDMHSDRLIAINDRAQQQILNRDRQFNATRQKLASQQMSRLAEEQAQQAADLKAQMVASNSRLALTGGIATALIGGLSLSEYSKFNQEMTKATSIMENNADQTERMARHALELSRTVVHGPTDLARGYLALASSGKTAEQSIAMIAKISQFATIGLYDIEDASRALIGIQKALGLSWAGISPEQEQKNLQRVADVISKIADMSLSSTKEVTEALANHLASSGRILKKDIEEIAAAYAVFADQLRIGKVGGHEVDRVLRLLGGHSLTGKQIAARKAYGFNPYDRFGRMKNIADLAENLQEAVGGLGAPDQQISTRLEDMGFEVRIQQVVKHLLGMHDEVRRFEKGARDASNSMGGMGHTALIASKQMNSFENQMKLVRNTLDNVAINIGDALAPHVLRLSKGIAYLENQWNGLNSNLKSFLRIVLVIAGLIGPVYLLVKGLGLLKGAILLAATSLSRMVTGAALSMTTYWRLGIVAATIVLIEMAKQINNSRQSMKDLNAEFQRSDEISKRISDAQSRRRSATIDKGLSLQDERERRAFFQEELRKSEQGLKTYTDNIDALEKRVKKLEPFLPSIGGFQPELKTSMIPIWNLIEWGANADVGNGPQNNLGMSEDVAGWEEAKRMLAEAQERLRALREHISNVRQELDKIGPDVGNQKLFNILGERIHKMSEDLEFAAKTIGMTNTEIDIYKLRVEQAAVETNGWADMIQKMINLEKIADLEAFNKWLEKKKKEHEDVNNLKEGVDKLTKSMKEQIATFGMSGAEIEIYRLEVQAAELMMSKAVAKKLANARAMAEELKSLERIKETAEKVKETIKQFQDPIVTLQQKQAELTSMFLSGAITIDIYAKGMIDAAKATMTLKETQDKLNNTFDATLVNSAEYFDKLNKHRSLLLDGRFVDLPAAKKNFVPLPMGLFPQNRLQPPMRPEWGWGLGNEGPKGRHPGWFGGQGGRQRPEPRMLWETSNREKDTKGIEDLLTLILGELRSDKDITLSPAGIA